MLFGLTMLVVGMGGTLVTLGVMAGILHLLTRVFPVKEEPEQSGESRP